jgi:hypothetical protein
MFFKPIYALFIIPVLFLIASLWFVCSSPNEDSSFCQKAQAALKKGDTAFAEDLLINVWSRLDTFAGCGSFRNYFRMRAFEAAINEFIPLLRTLPDCGRERSLSGQELSTRSSSLLNRGFPEAAIRMAILAFLKDTSLDREAERQCQAAENALERKRIAKMKPAELAMFRSGNDIPRIHDSVIKNRLLSLCLYHFSITNECRVFDQSNIAAAKYLSLFLLSGNGFGIPFRKELRGIVNQCAFLETARKTLRDTSYAESRSYLVEERPEWAYIIARKSLMNDPKSLVGRILREDAVASVVKKMSAEGKQPEEIVSLSENQLFAKYIMSIVNADRICGFFCVTYNGRFAREIADILLQDDSNSVCGRLFRARILLADVYTAHRAEYVQAAADADAAIKGAPNDTLAWALKAAALDSLGDDSGAVCAYSRVLDLLDTGSLHRQEYSLKYDAILGVLNARARCYGRLKRFDSASEDALTVARISGKTAGR